MADETSIWKKEISFGRKRKDPKDGTPKQVEPDFEYPAKTSIWKKELSFGRKKESVEDASEPVADDAPRHVAEFETVPVAPPPVAPAPQAPLAPTIPFANETAGQALGLTPEAPQPPAPAPTPAPASVHPLPPAPPQQPVQPPAAAGEHEARPRPHLVPVQSLPAEPSAPQAVPAAPPAPAVPAPLPGIHSPVPADELPEGKPEKVPFWKKDISPGGKSKPKAEKQPKPEKAKKAKKQKEPKASKQPKAPKEAKAPFWKKELSLGGKSKSKAEGPAEPRAKKPPLWKRDIAFGRPKVGGSGGRGGQVKKLVGLKVGASQVAAARVHNNGAPELVQIAREDLEPGVVVGGELRDMDALAVALKAFFRKNKLPTRGVRLGIANNRIGVRTFDVVGIDDPKQLDNAIRFRAQEALPIPIDEAVLDYQILGESTDDEGQPVKRVLLVVAYRELVDRYVAACKKAGIRLAGIDLEAFALLRALSAPRRDPDSEGAVVAVAIGSERSTFAVSDGITCQFTRVLDWGGASLDVAIARALNLTPSQAEPFKRQLSLEPGASAPEGLTAEQADAALQAVRAQLQAFARELVSSLQFYQNQPESLGIGEIVVTGGSAHLPGLASELQRLIGVLVRVGDPLGRVKLGKKIEEGDRIGSLAVAIGLGIED